MKKRLTAKAICEDKELCIAYSSSDESVVKVDANGLVTAIGEGYAVITAGVDECCSTDYAVTVVSEKPYVHTSIGNPYLPIWEHIPDGEPYVFEDPDAPGKYRVYVYGSHDTKLTHYCGYEQVLWSAPVEDLTKWTYHGEIFRSTVNGTRDTLYAPDVAEVIAEDGKKTYYFYPNNQSGGRRSMVAKADRPDGPFVVCNWSNDKRTLTEGPLGFDVAVLYDEGKAYGYWGFQNHEDCCFAELDTSTMATLKEGTEVRLNLPTRVDISSPDYDPGKYNIYQDEYAKMWGFFEAPSIRKIGNKYVLIFSRRGLAAEPWGCNTYQLAYGYSDSPEGPWKWGGIVVDAGGEAVPKSDNKYARTFPADNTHGSICEINGQWYVFYHRANNRFSRQSTVDTVNVSWDEKPVSEGGAVRITMAEMTSKGFHTDGLEPFVKYPASIVCFLTGRSGIEAVYDKHKELDPVIISEAQTIAGIKYFRFDNNAPKGINVTLMPQGKPFTVDVYLRPTAAVNTAVERENGAIVSVGEGSFKVGSLNISSEAEQTLTDFRIPFAVGEELCGEWGLFFTFSSEKTGTICEFHSFELY